MDENLISKYVDIHRIDFLSYCMNFIILNDQTPIRIKNYINNKIGVNHLDNLYYVIIDIDDLDTVVNNIDYLKRMSIYMNSEEYSYHYELDNHLYWLNLVKFELNIGDIKVNLKSDKLVRIFNDYFKLYLRKIKINNILIK